MGPNGSKRIPKPKELEKNLRKQAKIRETSRKNRAKICWAPFGLGSIFEFAKSLGKEELLPKVEQYHLFKNERPSQVHT